MLAVVGSKYPPSRVRETSNRIVHHCHSVLFRYDSGAVVLHHMRCGLQLESVDGVVIDARAPVSCLLCVAGLDWM